jgi:hypothetical protein
MALKSSFVLFVYKVSQQSGIQRENENHHHQKKPQKNPKTASVLLTQPVCLYRILKKIVEINQCIDH